MSIATVVTRGYGTFGTVAFVTTAGYGDFDTDTGRSKDYSIDGIPIQFSDDTFDYAAAREAERRRQILHEDQIMSDLIAQAVTSRMLE